MVTTSQAGRVVSPSNAKKLSKIYYDPGHYGSFSSVNRLWAAAGKKIPKRVVSEWLIGQDTFTRHKSRRVKFRRNCYILNNIDQLWESDLIVMPSEYTAHNDGVKYILVVIDCFSKFLFSEPLKRKTTEAIIDGFKKIFQKTCRRPDRLQTDKGGEYDSSKFRKFMKTHEITYNTTNNPDIKCSIAERVIRTIKGRLFKYLTYKNTYKYVDVLDKIINGYNESYHRTIKMTPKQVNDCNILEVYQNIKDSQKVPATRKIPKLKVGDYVRITKSKGVFDKGYSANWTLEPFRIKSIATRNPPVYYLDDLAGEEISGTFYEHEVQKINFDEGAASAIEKIIKTKGKGKNAQYLVKWAGYPSKFNSWVNAKAIQSI